MRKRWIYVLLVLISAMLLLLLVIQVMWLRSAAAAEKRAAQMSVDKALLRVGTQLRDRSYCFESYGKAYIDTGESFMMLRTTRKGKTDTLDIYFDETFTRDKKEVGTMKQMDLSWPFKLDILLLAYVEMNDSVGYINDKRQFYQGLKGTKLTEIIRDKRTLESVYDMNVVDSLIKLNLTLEKRDTVFGYGFINTETKKVEYADRVVDSAALLASPFHSMLFADNRFSNPYKLAIVFPQTAQIFKVNNWLLVSLAIIGLLAFSFYAFVRLFLKQTQLSKMKSDFIHNLTHEFNTPMANIALALETLECNGLEQDTKTQKVIRIIATESERLRENIERSLQVATMDEGELALHKEEIDLAQLLQTVISAYQMQCEALGGGIEFVPEVSPMIYADETHLLNCVVNLLDNSLKYRGANPPSIVISLEEKPCEVLLTVSDNGIGMSSETQKYIFDKFYRAHQGDTHNTKGFGLGLSYVKGIIDAHNGTIEVWSKLGKGSRFLIRLPKIKPDGKK